VKKEAEDKLCQNEGPADENREEDTANDHDDARKSNNDDSGVEKLRNLQQRQQNLLSPSSLAQPSNSVSSTDQEDNQTTRSQSASPNYSRDEIGSAATSRHDDEKYWNDKVADLEAKQDDLEAKMDTEIDEKESILRELVRGWQELKDFAEQRMLRKNYISRKCSKANAMKRKAQTELRRSNEKCRMLEADFEKLQDTLRKVRQDLTEKDHERNVAKNPLE
jgi:chromosome segregation ATPase